MNITPQLIPHNEFHRGIWLQSVENPGWYYFMKKDNPNIISDSLFLESVDESLRDLVSFLYKKGIRTTPSCSGHFKNDRNFKNIYSDLESDKKQITGDGLELKDVETGNIYLFNDEKYLMPWGRDNFISKVLPYQHQGVLGMRLENKNQLKEKILRIDIENTIIQERDDIIFIFTNEINKNDNKVAWDKITGAVINVFEKFAFI